MKRRAINRQMHQNRQFDNGPPQMRFPVQQQWNYIPLSIPNVNVQMMNGFHRAPFINNNMPLQFPSRHAQPQYRAARPKKSPKGNTGRGGRPWGNKNNDNNKRQLNPDENEDDERGGKRAKVDKPSTSPSQSDSESDQFVVPCSKGTEKITVAIWEYFLKNKMSDEDLEKKLMLQKTIHGIIKEACPDSRLFIVGSSMTGFATRTSDVDMCLYISDKEINQKKQAPIILRSLLRSLRCCSFIRNAMVIPAKCPILKFKDNVSGFECDINVNNHTGIRNTHLLRYYAHMDWRVRPLMLFIKHWARYHDINDASKKTISSYSLCLMLLHYLQAGVKPPVLPCLQSLRPLLFSKENHVCDLSLDLEEIDFTSRNTSTLGELLLGFLDYYTNEFSYDEEIISIREGQTITHNDVNYQDSDWKFLCIEEPFEGTNTARSVFDHFVFLRILRVIHASYKSLMKDRDTKSILESPF